MDLNFLLIESSPVNKSVKYQNRGTTGVQIPFSSTKMLDFKPFQTKVRVLPWQIKSTFIIVLILLILLRIALIYRAYQSIYIAPNAVTEIRNGEKCVSIKPCAHRAWFDAYRNNINDIGTTLAKLTEQKERGCRINGK